MLSEYNIRPSTVVLALVVLAAAVAVGSGTVVGQTANEVDIQDPGNEIVESGSTDLIITGVDSTEGVGAFEVNVTYNDNIDSIQVSDSDRFTVESETHETNGNTTVTIVGYTGETDASGEETVTLAEIQTTSQSYGTTGEIQVDEVSTLIAPEGDDIVPVNIGQGASFSITESTGNNNNDPGGSPSGGTDAETEEESGETDQPTVQEVREQLDSIEPSTTTQTEIADNDPDTPGTQITPEGTESVRSISFETEELSGNVDINEYSNPPQQIRNDVASSVTAAGAAAESSSINTISVADITPDNDAAEDSPATVEFAVPASEVDNPDQLTVFKETYSQEQQEDTWSELDTTVDNVGDEEITVSARAESFSLFAVSEVEPAEDESAGDDGAQDDGQQDDGQQDGGPSTALLVVGLLVVLAAIGAFIYAQQD